MRAVKDLERVILGADASTTLGGGTCGADPFDTATIFHELDVAVACVVQLDRLPLALGEEECRRNCNERSTRRTEQVSEKYRRVL